jgi:hypothetical protein
MKQNLVIFSFCIAGLLSAVHADPAPAPKPLYEYRNGVKTPLYYHPHLYVKPARESSVSPRSSTNGIGQADGWQVYRSDDNDFQLRKSTETDHDRFQLYSTDPDWRNSSIQAQEPGVVVIFKKTLSVQDIQQWFAQKNLNSKRLSWDYAYLIPDIHGEEAVRLAAEIFESGVAEVAQPNWVKQVN